MITKGSLRKQTIVSISNDNKAKFIVSSSKHITNFNRALKNTKSEVMVDFAHIDQNSIVIVTNKITSSLDLQTIEKYIKNIEYFNSEDINTSHLPQSESYLKIIGISYLLENTNILIILDFVKTTIKNNHIFNNIAITSKSCIIKVSSKSNIAIIWLDIQDAQSGSKAKGLINRYFNVESYIITIQGVNMNLEVPQYKNCWKQGYVTFSCQAQGSKCIKYKGLYKTEHYC